MKITRTIVGPQALGEKPATAEEIRALNEEFYGNILPMLENRLQQTEYLCGDEYTVGDIKFYNEIMTVLAL